MDSPLPGPIGLIADSHGRNDLLLKTIRLLCSLHAATIIHLGDICDSLAPHTLEEAVHILKEYGVKAVRGNNEHAILAKHNGSNKDRFSAEVYTFLSDLPYTITQGDICFTHSAPYEWPGATSWPITDDHPLIDIHSMVPHRILFRGHSHTPSIVSINGMEKRTFPVDAGLKQKLSSDARYVVTVGAVEEGSSALFMPDAFEIRFLGED